MMAPLTVRQARQWSIALPIFAGAMAVASLLTPAWGYHDGPLGYRTDLHAVLLGASFAATLGLALSRTPGARVNGGATAALCAWGLAFGAWFPWAVHTLAGTFLPGAGSGLFGLRADSTISAACVAACLAFAGLVTAGLVWRATGSKPAALWTAGATLVCIPAGLESAFYFMDYGLAIPWHVGVGAGLGQFVLGVARSRKRGICPGCGYSLAGLPDGRGCPECGGDPGESR